MKPEVGTMLVKEDSWLFKVMLNCVMTNFYSAKENDEVNWSSDYSWLWGKLKWDYVLFCIKYIPTTEAV